MLYLLLIDNRYITYKIHTGYILISLMVERDTSNI